MEAVDADEKIFQSVLVRGPKHRVRSIKQRSLPNNSIVRGGVLSPIGDYKPLQLAHRGRISGFRGAAARRKGLQPLCRQVLPFTCEKWPKDVQDGRVHP